MESESGGCYRDTMEQFALQPARAGIDILGLRLEVVGDLGAFSLTIAPEALAADLAEVTFQLSAGESTEPPAITIRCTGQAAGISHSWRVDQSRSATLLPDWHPDRLRARASSQAPLLCLHGLDGMNRVTLALADAMHGCAVWPGVREEDARLLIGIEPFQTGRAPAAKFSVRLRLDTRAQPWYDALQAMGRWWASLPGYAPLAVPDIGREPMYSTWYTFHQAVDPQPVLAECQRAKVLGCSTVIVDDGWQTLDGSRGYHLAGDWQPERMGDMAAFVSSVHALGLRIILWYAVPLIGYHTAVFPRFERMLLRREEWLGCAVLDPRYPEVREYLISLYERQFKAWDLDGVKLDFVDAMVPPPGMALGATDGRDIGDLDEAVDVLMKTIADRLCALKPEVLIEFRQGYVGPLMRRYGNLFRAADCAYDAQSNRERTIALRMLAGETAVHADMLMWSPLDAPEVAARQFLAVLFSVPQISVAIERLTLGQRAMLTFWLGWWKAHRSTLLDGKLSAEEPQAGYPLICAESATERIMAVYADRAVRLTSPGPARTWIVNATPRGDLLVDGGSEGFRACVVRDCTGSVIAERSLSPGVHPIVIPPSGLVQLDR
jgi:alpha-galactosidase